MKRTGSSVSFPSHMVKNSLHRFPGRAGGPESCSAWVLLAGRPRFSGLPIAGWKNMNGWSRLSATWKSWRPERCWPRLPFLERSWGPSRGDEWGERVHAWSRAPSFRMAAWSVWFVDSTGKLHTEQKENKANLKFATDNFSACVRACEFPEWLRGLWAGGKQNSRANENWDVRIPGGVWFD